MTRLHPPRMSDRISRVLVHSAILVGAMFWASERSNGNSAVELEQAQESHEEMRSLRAERDLLRSDVWVLRDQLQTARRERDLARSQRSIEDSPELPGVLASVHVPVSDSAPLQLTSRELPLPPVRGDSVKTQDAERIKQEPTASIEVVPVAMLRAVPEPMNPEPAVALVSATPSLEEFRSDKHGSAKLSLEDEEGFGSVVLQDYRPAFERSRAEGLWREVVSDISHHKGCWEGSS